MTTEEKLSIENDNTDRIICLREGMFWKLYERSAFLFSKQVKALKPTRKYFKGSGEQVVSIGFPDTSLDSFLKGYDRILDLPDRVEVKSRVPVNLEEFQQWKEGVKLRMPGAPMVEPAAAVKSFSGVETAIRNFDLAHSSPVDCFELVSRLQTMLQARG